MASRLPLRSHRFVAGFLSDTLRIRRQLATTLAWSPTGCKPS